MAARYERDPRGPSSEVGPRRPRPSPGRLIQRRVRPVDKEGQKSHARGHWAGYDLPATALRRTLPRRLAQQDIDLEPVNVETAPANEILSRDQRAHRRLSWEQPLARNRQPARLPALRLLLHGVPVELAAYLSIPSREPSAT